MGDCIPLPDPDGAFRLQPSLAGAFDDVPLCGQVKISKSRPVSLGSIAESFIVDPQAVHCGP